MTTLIVTQLGKGIVEGSQSSNLQVTQVLKGIIEDTSQAALITPVRKRAFTYIRYGDRRS